MGLAVTTLSVRGEPADAATLEGTDAVLSVDAVGAEPIRYQWHRDGQRIPGAQGPMLRLVLWTLQETFVAGGAVRWLQEPVRTDVRARFYRLVEKP